MKGYCEEKIILLLIEINSLFNFFVLLNGKKDLKMVLEAAKIRPDMAKSLSAWIGGLK